MKIITETADTVESSPRASTPVRRAALLGLLGLAAMLGACVYRVPIRQGNYLDPVAIAQVKPGMTHSQVRYLLGTPMVPSTFDASRWDYDYYLNLHRLRNPPRQHLTIYFSNNLVSRVVSSVSQAPVTYIVSHGVRYPTPY